MSRAILCKRRIGKAIVQALAKGGRDEQAVETAPAVKVKKPGTQFAEATRVTGDFLRDVMKLNLDTKNFRVFGPDETASSSPAFGKEGTTWKPP